MAFSLFSRMYSPLWHWVWQIALCACVSCNLSHAAQWQTLEIGQEIVRLEVADTAESQRLGLMHRKALPANTGMLFVFARPRSVAMWMRNTPIDLDVAFVNACARIVNIATMVHDTDDLHPSMGAVAWAIEMPAGWFARHGVHTGDTISGLVHPQCQKRK